MSRKTLISVSIPPDTLKTIDKMKDKENRSRNYILNILIEEGLKKIKQLKEQAKQLKIVKRKQA